VRKIGLDRGLTDFKNQSQLFTAEHDLIPMVDAKTKEEFKEYIQSIREELIRGIKTPLLEAIKEWVKEGVKEGVALGVKEETRDEKEEVATDVLIEKLIKATKEGAKEEDIKRVLKKLLKE
jgi:hypothetical protein